MLPSSFLPLILIFFVLCICSTVHAEDPALPAPEQAGPVGKVIHHSHIEGTVAHDAHDAASAPEICRVLGVNLPTFCKLAEAGFDWLFKSPKIKFVKDLCHHLPNSDGSTTLKQPSVASLLSPDGIMDFVGAFVHQKLDDDGEADPKVKAVCEDVAHRTVDACHLLLTMSVSHSMSDFKWLCFLIPQSEAHGVCDKVADALFGVCKRALGPAAFIGLENNSNARSPMIMPMVRKTPADVCMDLAPTMDATCSFAKSVGSKLFGNKTGKAVQSACDVMRTAVSVPIASDVISKGDHLALKACDGFVRAFAPICQKVTLNQVNFYVGLSWICDLTGKFSGFKFSHTVYETSLNVKPYDDGTTKVSHTGGCKTFVAKLCAICRADTTNCNSQIEPTEFNCEGLADGFYPDSIHRCANYYFRCANGTRYTIGCYRGSQYIYVPELNTCKNKLDVRGCESVLPPCLAQRQLKKVNPRKITCDPDLQAPLNTNPMLRHNKPTSQTRLRKVERLSDKQLEFDCTGKKDGKYLNLRMNCSATHFECKGGNVTVQTCPNDHHVYKIQSTMFGYISKDKCLKRSEVPGCELVPCPAHHPLRITCDPYVPPLPDAYYDGSYEFDCSGKPVGLYANPFTPCTDKLYLCKKPEGKGVLSKCNKFGGKRNYIFSDEVSHCVPKDETPRCADYLPACSKNDPLRISLEMEASLQRR